MHAAACPGEESGLRRALRKISSTLAVLPVRGDVGARLVEMDMLVDMIDPGHRNEMMMLTVRRALLGQLDLVGAFEMVDLPDRFAVRRNDIHVLLDLRCIRHVASPRIVPGLNAPGPAPFPGRRIPVLLVRGCV